MTPTFRDKLSRASAGRRLLLVAIVSVLPPSLSTAHPLSDEPRSRVEPNFSLAAPRSVEDLTQVSVTRDYGHAWDSLAVAMSSSAPELLNAYFAGPAKSGLANAIASQNRVGIRCHYLEPRHKLEAIFYSPEGDVMELHDTAEFRLQLTAGQEVIHDEHIILHYVVLMTPAADRWVVRHLQAVSQF